ncbi:hypothetical protein A2331_00365 [Candidatus Falkowbacteria bacterium RIFOXYB2_FULL_34_18]|uniref:Type II secretion system protein GspG C-terminal domain-containing protein n=1 Tax=Candidatus Falkowbacteria bacterium RIFOXYD2_FULL_34_120 TaxID=1798007 RepID=A0A1F5TN25_9BACT|nr:MAG: hypothetical protein A2331_00365 [Candidatus Falkowbacteria bacterium RIFOXYB2_FULL_34_18]OGF29741.1 MAG: hypothetical protein A2500_02600 [Candidatus Falkowbacteria bacterium RIFOXYC12_FULL_34_55]OGF37901.1 MAG: hypothetical protein A2466_03105 [Candidatus Falkowbacteria bacterium RIFOXYC2_FULL_34_220]OGF39631.1 MAG: hypothetical protein A2515_06585 [Candidatus Falkowbacteria bacterium RIFOXYD12_FULL_34_57]OGF39891.1 MAG: hypothetical protein A2531_00770 [Candidatus Falkowbacteria bact
MHKNNNIKGFTLVELLVVIAIIGLLSTFAVVSLNEARLKARDARRLADVKQMMTALEIYYSSCGRYPSAVVPGGRVAGGDPIDCPMNTNIYLGLVPSNPLPRPDGGCPDSDYIYTRDNLSSYTIEYCIGQTVQGISGGGRHHATPAGLVDE